MVGVSVTVKPVVLPVGVALLVALITPAVLTDGVPILTVDWTPATPLLPFAQPVIVPPGESP